MKYVRFGNTTFRKLEQPQKASFSISWISSGKTISVMDLQFLKNLAGKLWS